MNRKFENYKNPSVAVDLIVFGYNEKNISVLLLNRNEEPFKGEWTLPGGFIQIKEQFIETCSRILKTKLGINNIYLEQLYSFDDVNRDPRGRVISIAYFALVNPEKFKIVAGKMANDVKWFTINNLPVLGFDHEIIFKEAYKRLKSKILYYPLGFELLNGTFTMTELHELYECILDVTIDRRNFRKKILDSEYIISTGKKRDGLKNRHPELYRFNNGLKENNFHLKF